MTDTVAARPRCDAPCPYGGLAATRKYSRATLGHMGHCNRTVPAKGDRCWQHRESEQSK